MSEVDKARDLIDAAMARWQEVCRDRPTSGDALARALSDIAGLLERAAHHVRRAAND